MEHKRSKKHDGGGLYIAICCCILVIALIGYANNLAEKNREEERFLAEQAGENIIAPEASTPAPTKTGTKSAAQSAKQPRRSSPTTAKSSPRCFIPPPPAKQKAQRMYGAETDRILSVWKVPARRKLLILNPKKL